MNDRKKYAAEFKDEVVSLCRTGMRPRSEISRDLGIPESTINRWVREAGGMHSSSNGSISGGLSAVEREELARLRKENKRLLMERDILKKAAAFFAKESE